MNIAKTVVVTEQILRRKEFSEGNAQHVETMQYTCLTMRLSIFSSTFVDFEVFSAIFSVKGNTVSSEVDMGNTVPDVQSAA